MLYPAEHECWTVVPRAVYEDSSERETHIGILMHGSERSNIEISWHQVANTDNKLLLLRDTTVTLGLSVLSNALGNMQFSTDFEIAKEWQGNTKNKSCFLMVHCQSPKLRINEFIMATL